MLITTINKNLKRLLNEQGNNNEQRRISKRSALTRLECASIRIKPENKQIHVTYYYCITAPRRRLKAPHAYPQPKGDSFIPARPLVD